MIGRRLRWARLFMGAALVGFSLMGGAIHAIAEVAPRRGAADPRVRTVIYNSANVVSVDASHGVSTMIVLGDAEKIETVAVGDSLSWKIEPNKRGNIIFLKPVEAKTTTNMNVVSDKHVYTFILRAHAESEGDQTYMVKFRYPDEEADVKLLAEAQRLVSEPNRDNFQFQDTNTNYSFRGDGELKPKNAFDDGVKTWFRFEGDIPAIFIVEGGKREILANFRREGDYIVVDKIAKQWMLRRADYALCLFNLKAGVAVAAASSRPAENRMR
ncbi:P-type conjugative transfer protein VirB9 [Phyllobacterium endophyticum]|nr:P-type conjugative transfer protein VirB9 [Phyllobacterium endophyticum]MBB3238257.1 type IV secretion system protein VirB9 [Phyllobacterium endophyticum]